MTTRIAIVLLAGLAASALLAAGAQAQERKPADKPGRGQEFLQSLRRGEEIATRNERYVVLPDVRAVIRHGVPEAPQEALAALGVGPAEPLEVKGQFIIYHPLTVGSIAQANAVAQVDGQRVFPVAVNPRTGQFGIVTGSIAVRVENPADWEALAADYGLQLARRYEHLGVAFYQVAPQRDILAARRDLLADTRVIEAELEVLEHFNVPQ